MYCPTLKDLPLPPEGKISWPWTEEGLQLPDTMPDGKPWPKISIVTPNYNYGQFIEETIRSVLLQGYPDLEYIIIDGGSTDNSLEIIKKYKKWLAYWKTEPDQGQANAINVGFSKTTGEILAWLNSDDIYLNGALYCVVQKLDITKAELIFGNCFNFVENKPIFKSSNVKAAHQKHNLLLVDYIIQPSTFWTRKTWLATRLLDEKLNFAFDWDWFIRAKRGSVIFIPEDRYLSNYRLHKTHKSRCGGKKRLEEISLIYRKYSGIKYEKLFLWCCINDAKIALIKRWVHQLRLTTFEIPILKLIFPNLFLFFKNKEIRDILKMF